MSAKVSPNSNGAPPQPAALPKPDRRQSIPESVTRTDFQSQDVLEPLAYRKRSAAKLVGISVRTLERLLSAGKFPRPIAHAGRCPLWTKETLIQWLAQGGSLK